MPFSFVQSPNLWYDLLVAPNRIAFNTGVSDYWGVDTTVHMNSWVQVTAIFKNGDRNGSRLFINGIEQRLTDLAPAAAPRNSFNGVPNNATGNVMIGNWNDLGAPFNGQLAELAIFNRSLTAEEVREQVSAATQPIYTGRSDSIRIPVSVGQAVLSGTKYLDSNGDGVRDGSNRYRGTALAIGATHVIPLNEKSGGLVSDVRGNSSQSMPTSGVTIGVEGAWGNAGDSAFQFHGGLITATHGATTSGPNRTTTGVNTLSFMMKWDGTNRVVPVGLTSQDLWLWDGYIGTGPLSSGGFWATSSAGLANRWVHIISEFHNDSLALNRLWIDGVEQELTFVTNGSGAPGAATAVNLTIGGTASTTAYRFRGALDEIAMFNRALNDVERTQLANAASSPTLETGNEGTAIYLDGYVGSVYDPTKVNGQYDLGETLTVTAIDGGYQLTALASNTVFDVRQELPANQKETQGGGQTDTTKLLEVLPSAASGNPDGMVELAGKLYFRGLSSTGDYRLFVYDGQNATLVATIALMPNGPATEVRDLVAMGGKLYFSGLDTTGKRQLWSYQPATATLPASIDRLSSVSAGSGFDPRDLVATSGKLVFTADDGITGRELWTYDGTLLVQALNLNGREGVGACDQTLDSLQKWIRYLATPFSVSQRPMRCCHPIRKSA